MIRPPPRSPLFPHPPLFRSGREPTPDELAVELDMTPEKVIEVQKYGREPISLHTPLGEDGDSEFGDLIEDSEAIQDRKSTRLNSSHSQISYAVFCLKKKHCA